MNMEEKNINEMGGILAIDNGDMQENLYVAV